MMISILINNLMRAWARFIRNIYKDEAYLTHTIPVSRTKIYISKILSAIITMFTSAIVIAICVAISYYSKGNIEWIKASLELVASTYDSTVLKFLLIMFIVIFLELLFALYAGYLGIIIAHKSNNFRIVKSIIFGYLTFMSASAFSLIAIYILGLFNTDVMSLFNSVTTFNIEAIKFVLYSGIVLYIIYISLYCLIGNKLLKKGINLE